MDDLGRLMLVVGVCIVVTLYIAVLAWRVNNRRDRRAPAPGTRPFERMSRAERKAAAVAGTTPVRRPDLADAEARVLAAAARLAGREPPTEPPRDDTETATQAQAQAQDDATTIFGPGNPRRADTADTPPALRAPSTPSAPSLFRATDDEPTAAAPVSSVAELLAGIRLPESLAPLTEVGPRAEVVDRVAFVAMSEPAEIVAPAFALELERLGFTTSLDGYDTLTARRGPDTARVVVHKDASQAYLDGRQLFPTAPPFAAVIEVWIPTR